MVVFFAGTKEAHPDTSIMIVVSRDGMYWSKPRTVAKIAGIAHWNPVLTEQSDGKVQLYFKTGNTPSSWKTHRMILWGFSDELKDQNEVARGPVRSSILKTKSGVWIAPASHEVVLKTTSNAWRPNVIWDSFVDRSEDEGETWQRTEFIPYDRERFGEFGGTIQPTLWESSPGNIHMLLRSTIKKICRSDSSDCGKTWSPIETIDLPNNNSGIDISKNPNTGALALVYNPVGADWGARTPISVAFSKGEGRDWALPVEIEGGQGSFSYPSVAPLGDGFAVTYTWNRTNIRYVEFEQKNKRKNYEHTKG